MFMNAISNSNHLLEHKEKRRRRKNLANDTAISTRDNSSVRALGWGQVVPVILLSSTGEVSGQVRKLATLAGVEVHEQAIGTATPPAALIIEEEKGGYIQLTLSPYLRGPGIPGYPQHLHVVGDNDVLLDALVVAAYPFIAKLVVVTGTSGGVGASLLACALAREVAGKVGLIDFSLAGPGLDVLCAQENQSGMRWADIPSSALLPARLAKALPKWNEIWLLGADARGGANGGANALAALRAMGQFCEVLVIDAPAYLLSGVNSGKIQNRSVTIGENQEIQQSESLNLGINWQEQLWMWADELVIVSQPGVRGGAATLQFLSRVQRYLGMKPNLVVRTNSTSQALAIGEATGLEKSLALMHERRLEANLEHGLTPGDTRGALKKCAQELVKRLDLASA